MDQELDEAYRETTYYADTPRGRLALRIGQCDRALDGLLAEHGVRSWAFLTAHNPRSKRLPVAENQRRQALLESELRAGGWNWFAGEGVGAVLPAAGCASADWPPETSTLVLGIDEVTAKRLGKAFGQNAIVVGCQGQPAELVWID